MTSPRYIKRHGIEMSRCPGVVQASTTRHFNISLGAAGSDGYDPAAIVAEPLWDGCEINTRIVAGVTESLPNLKTGSPPKRVASLKASTHAAFKAMERQKPFVVMKRTDAVYPVQWRSGRGASSVGGVRPK